MTNDRFGKNEVVIQKGRVMVDDFRWQASSYKDWVMDIDWGSAQTTVGAGLPAKIAQAMWLSRRHALSLTTFAGKPAPTDQRASCLSHRRLKLRQIRLLKRPSLST